MKKGIIPKLSMGVALAAAAAVCWTSAARADLSGGSDTVTYTQGATTLVMPFDQTGNRVSFQIVSTINQSTGGEPIATHWSYWADDCRHLADVTICLTPNDTIVVDPTKLHGEIQSFSPPENHPTTPDFNLGKVRGSVFVTAFQAFTGTSGLQCEVISDHTTVPNSLVGSWTIANVDSNAAYGVNAIGLSGVADSSADNPPDPDVILGGNGDGAGGLRLQSFNPQSLGNSKIIAITVSSGTGFGTYQGFEWGPIKRAETCCDSEYTDNIEQTTSHPQFCFLCSGVASISPAGSEAGSEDPVILPVEINTPGVLHLFNCAVQQDSDQDQLLDLIGLDADGNSEYLFAYHNQAVGQFGVTTSAFYTGDSGL